MPTYKLIDDSKELFQRVFEYNKEAAYFRELLGNAPKYFVNFKYNEQWLFGLSKFCAFKDITVEAYLREFRYKTDGGKTQKHIAKVTNQQWLNYNKQPIDVRDRFEQWIRSYFPSYNVSLASFITLSNTDNSLKRSFTTSPDDFQLILQQRQLIGQVGERIALAYEIERLRSLGDKNPQASVVHTALYDVGAGYDIFSDYNKHTRLIEVKATINGLGDTYITRNELENLRNNLGKGFVYIVHISDLKSEAGQVVREIDKIEDLGLLEPVLYKLIK